MRAYASTGTDRAYLYNSAGDDTFYGLPTYSYLKGTGFYNYANGFDRVYVDAHQGGNDTVKFYDSSGADTFTARPDYDRFTGPGFVSSSFSSATPMPPRPCS